MVKRAVFFERLITGAGAVSRKGEYLVEEATPLYCAHVAKRNLANYVKCIGEDDPQTESPEQTALRERLEREYTRVLSVMIDVVAALKRLHKLEYPEDDVEIGGDDREKTVDYPAVAHAVDRKGNTDLAI